MTMKKSSVDELIDAKLGLAEGKDSKRLGLGMSEVADAIAKAAITLDNFMKKAAKSSDLDKADLKALQKAQGDFKKGYADAVKVFATTAQDYIYADESKQEGYRTSSETTVWDHQDLGDQFEQLNDSLMSLIRVTDKNDPNWYKALVSATNHIGKAENVLEKADNKLGVIYLDK